MRFDESLRYLPTQDVDNVAVDTTSPSNRPRAANWAVSTASWSILTDRTLRYYVVTRFGEWGMKLGLVPFVPGCLDAEHGVLRLLDHATAQPLG